MITFIFLASMILFRCFSYILGITPLPFVLKFNYIYLKLNLFSASGFSFLISCTRGLQPMRRGGLWKLYKGRIELH